VLSRLLPSAGLPFRRAAFTAAAMIFIAAACVVATTTVVVGVAVATRVHELLAPAAKQSCFPADAETKESVEQRDDSAGCTAHLLHLYQQA
jgi:hypothetical protein